MTLSNLTVKSRLLLLGIMTNGLLVLLFGLGALALERLNERLDQALQHQDQVRAAENVAQGARFALKSEAQAIDSAMLAAADAAAREHQRAAFEESAETVDEHLAALELLMPAIGLPARPATEARAACAALAARYRDALAGFSPNASGLAAAEHAMQDIDAQASAGLDDLASLIYRHADVVATQALRDSTRDRDRSVVLLGIVAAVTLLVSVVTGLVNARSIVAPLGQAVELVRAVAHGDLTARVDSRRGDELGQVLRSLAEMNASLIDIVTRVQAGAQAVMHASSDMAGGNVELASRTEQQATSLEQTAASMEEMAATVDQNAESAKRATALATDAATVAKRGGEVVLQVVRMMDAIQDSSRRISEITGLIDSIAFQTSILALNAAVEAARGGESGRGFAVVATEVRGLAQRSAQAAREIKQLITGAVERVNSGAMLADDAGRTMEEVTKSVADVSHVIGAIAAATSEQRLGISQINQAVTELERVTQQNATMVQRSSAASESLKQMAEQLERAMAFFKVARPAGAEAPVEVLPPAPGLDRLDLVHDAVHPLHHRLVRSG